jgi:hypothetical protein
MDDTGNERIGQLCSGRIPCGLADLERGTECSS